MLTRRSRTSSTSVISSTSQTETPLRWCAERERALTTDFLEYTTPAWKNFGFMYRNVTTCDACGKISRSVPNPLNRLQVPMTRSPGLNLKALIEKDLREEPLRDNDRCGDLQWEENNSGCGARNCRRICKAILSWPEVLVVHLKRFELNVTNGRFDKIDGPVRYGRTLQVLDSPEYTLRAMVMHNGRYGSGHYTACVRTVDNSWLLCDDERRPQPMVEEQVFPQQVSSIHRKAYIFFYERTPGSVEATSAPSASSQGPPRTN